jgi:uncharacterized protein YchJ
MYKLQTIIFIPLTIWFVSFFYACDDGFDDFSSNPNHLLSFSRDTIAFDTIISTINTPFQTFKVYNRNSKALLISAVSLENGNESGFKINVDGRAGNAFENIEIRGNDSLFVFVDAKPAKTGSNEPEYLTDYIVFTTNGVRQKVVLEASAQDAEIWRGLVIHSDTTLNNEKPFVIFDSLLIKEGATLHLQEGTIFYMHSGSEIIVQGNIKAKGRLEKPIVIRGDRFGYVAGVPYDLIPGQWEGFRFESSSFDNELEYMHIRNGKNGMNFQLSDPKRLKAKMKNLVVTNFKGTLINSVNCHIEAENCEFTNSKDALLNLVGGKYSFTHCTMANYYFSSLEYGWGNSTNQTVVLSNNYFNNEKNEVEFYPITQANFYNTIIWGSQYRYGSQFTLRESEESSIDYLLKNCLFPHLNASNDDESDPNNVPRVVNCIINQDPQFSIIMSKNPQKLEFIYDFRLDSISPARNKADVQMAEKVPYDINGISRFLDGEPDMGGYEWKEN